MEAALELLLRGGRARSYPDGRVEAINRIEPQENPCS
jgi:hypothetical protein